MKSNNNKKKKKKSDIRFQCYVSRKKGKLSLFF